jgi:hypothetical protein
MNLSLLDPKLIVLAAVVILIIALPGCTCENAGVRLPTCGKGLGPSTSGRCGTMGQKEKQKRN